MYALFGGIGVLSILTSVVLTAITFVVSGHCLDKGYFKSMSFENRVAMGVIVAGVILTVINALGLIQLNGEDPLGSVSDEGMMLVLGGAVLTFLLMLSTMWFIDRYKEAAAKSRAESISVQAGAGSERTSS